MKGQRMRQVCWKEVWYFVKKEREHGVKEIVNCMIAGLEDEETSLSHNYGKNVDKINEVQAIIFRLNKLNAKLKYNDKK